MPDPAPRKLVTFAAVFTASEIVPSRDFYLKRLGFRVFFELGDPPSYAIIERDAVSLHLMPANQEARGLGGSSIYVFATEVDGLHDELLGRGCPIETAPADYEYGMREFSVRDPDGNRITFGQQLKP
jgi:catechol 2,3-dioxygenase-like lactoylglutathione lyase family enzyme